MWFLEHESLFGNKRIWLRPGSQQLFGRTKPSAGDNAADKKVFIDNKNVSRKHMMVKVLEVPPENAMNLHWRSQIEVTDLSCRQGTVVDGEQILKSTKGADSSIVYDKTTLTGTEHTIRLSSSYPDFKIKWKDVVFTYASKEKKENSKASTRTAQLNAMDIKTSQEFIFGTTTHVVSQKRNLPKVLDALVAGKPVVTTDYLDAILRAATHSLDPDGNYVPSKLEEEFDTWWPQEKEYIPPTGAEPVPRPDQMLSPDPTRAEVFSGLTFIFLNESQYSNLNQAITGGGGKALHYQIRLGETTVEEYVDYVRSVAGKKRRANVNNGGLPVITVRLSAYPEGLEGWATDFVTGVDSSLKQRSILQNEFLDAIITKDTSPMRRSPTENMDGGSSIPAGTRSQNSGPEGTPAVQAQASPQEPVPNSAPSEEPAKPNPRKRPMRRAVSRFTGFDDYEPPTKTRKIEATPVEEVQESPSLPEAPSQDALVSQVHQAAQDEPAPMDVDEILPAAATIKRQRREAGIETATPAPKTEAAQVSPQERKVTAADRIEHIQRERKKAEKEINVKEESRKRVAEEDERRRLEEEGLREALEGVDISTIRANIQVEAMQLRRRKDRPNAASQARADDWKPEWNGRKNFKGFKRRGTERGHSQKVIVGLEEAPPRKGFGDAFFLEDVGPSRLTGLKARAKHILSQGGDSDSESELGFTRRKRSQQAEVINVEDSDADMGNAPEGSGTSTVQRASGRTERVVETQLGGSQTQREAKKRSLVGTPAGEPSRKRGRFMQVEEDSDEEETGFRFRRRRG